MTDVGPVLYRRSPHLVFYWSGDELIAHNYATRTRVVAAPVVCDVLHFFHRWRSPDELFAGRPRLDRGDLQELIAILVHRTLLQRDDRPPADGERAMAAWAEWNPAAGFFHNATKDLQYGDLRTIERLTREKTRRTARPDSVKRYPGARVVSLPRIRRDGEFVDAVLQRRTWRRFGKRPIALPAFSTLLDLTSGIQSWLTGTSGERVALKTSPSGGARHPIELYALVLGVEGVPRGLYHYRCDRHALELIDSDVPARPVERYLPNQPWFSNASALILFTAVFPRIGWRYAHARAYRAALIEAGHQCQTFCLTATSLGLAPFCSMALADSCIEQDLAIDGITESVLYAAGVGTRPTGLGWIAPPIEGPAPPPLTRQQERRFPGQISRRTANR